MQKLSIIIITRTIMNCLNCYLWLTDNNTGNEKDQFMVVFVILRCCSCKHYRGKGMDGGKEESLCRFLADQKIGSSWRKKKKEKEKGGIL